jgi:hypothetical protein
MPIPILKAAYKKAAYKKQKALYPKRLQQLS